jgi:hypothetical protein
VVYRAYDERLQRIVLLHMLRRDLAAEAKWRQRFVDEAHASAARSHQSLLEVFDSGEIAGRPYLVTEYVAGPTLRELGALSLEEALLFFRQVVGAVSACQAAGVSHPPISSNNLIRVADGRIELVEHWLTTPEQMALDLACYRAPERAAGQPPTSASAVYALGLLLFEMLTGRRAIDGSDPRAVAQAHLTASVPPLAEVRPSIYAPSLDRLVQRATAREPGQRPPNAATLGQELDELRRALTGDTQQLDPGAIPRPSLRQQFERTTGRMRAPTVTPPTAPGDARAARVLAPRRSLAWLAVMLALFVMVSCSAYTGAAFVADRLFNLELPRPAVRLPRLADFGISLPEWLTGVVDGGGEILVVTGAPGLRLRAEPGLSAAVVQELPRGTLLRRLGGPVTADRIAWLRVRVRVGDQEFDGWVSASFVRLVTGTEPTTP